MADGIRLDGRIAVVTGAAGVIGTETIKLLAARGAKIVAVDRDAAALERAVSGLPASAEALAITADVTSEEDVIGYVAAAVKRFGTIDIFYNNAGIEGTITGMVEDTSPTSKKGAAHTTPTSEGEPVSASATAAVAAVAAGHDNDPAEQQHPKTIWATGGISTGHQALRVLNAGADVAMVYTGLVYGGAGTVTRMKKEMREEMAAGKIMNKEESPKA